MAGSSNGPAPERACQLGDLVEDLATGEAWTVDDYYSGDRYHPARVTLGRDTREGVVVTDRHPAQIGLVTPALQRSVYPGDGWPDHVMLQETGVTVAEFCGRLPRPARQADLEQGP
jgi:hypothetical protein